MPSDPQTLFLAAPRAEGKILKEIPPGYKKPARWDQLWGHKRVLIATHEGWEPIDRIESKEVMKRLPVMDEYTGRPKWDPKTQRVIMKTVPWHEVIRGVVWWRGNRLEEVSLSALAIPDPGKRSLRHG